MLKHVTCDKIINKSYKTGKIYSENENYNKHVKKAKNHYNKQGFILHRNVILRKIYDFLTLNDCKRTKKKNCLSNKEIKPFTSHSFLGHISS